MNATKVLFATDYSPASEGVMPWALALANGLGASLLIAHVDERLPSFRMGLGYSGIVEPGLEQLTKQLVAVVPTDSEVACEHRLLMGDPAQEIVQLADEEHVDVIVLGTHGRTGSLGLLMGSVAEGVSRRAKCPVIICKLPARA
jgi:nucleotide-binding universal stress UspA family protein